MSKAFSLLPLAATLLCSPALSTAGMPAFIAEAESASAKYGRLASSPESTERYTAGRKSEVNAQLATLARRENKAADYFVVSNMLYRASPDTSLALMQKADELSPDNPLIAFELAMHAHRAGNCPAALPLYDKATALTSSNPTLWTYMAHCQLVTGDHAAALKSWKKADFGKHHTRIERALYEVLSTANPDAQREELIASVNAGSPEAVCTLMELDGAWEQDWWNIDTNTTYRAHDVELVHRLAQTNTALKPAADLCIDAVKLPDAEFRDRLDKAGYLTRLPESPAMSYQIIKELSSRKLLKPEELLTRFEDQLVSRRQADPANRKTLDVLAFLYSATHRSDKLKDIDLYGWKTLKLPNYAASFIIGLPQTDPDYAQQLADAARDFPNNAQLQGLNLALHHNDKDRTTYLTRYAAAQFAEVKEHLYGKYRLSDYMASLEYEIGKSDSGLKWLPWRGGK